MPVNPNPSGVHHIGLRSMDFSRTKHFYQEIMGFKLIVNSQDLIIFQTGQVYIAFKLASPTNREGSIFTPFNVGLDHIALTCDSEEELSRLAAALDIEGVDHTGIKLDPAQKKKYIAFKDPDRIQWEFYMK